MLLALAPLSARAQTSHLIDTTFLDPGELRLNVKLTNVAISNSKFMAAVGAIQNIEVDADYGFFPGQTYFGLKDRLVNTKRVTVAAGIYEYSTRQHIVRPYLIASTPVLGTGSVSLGAVFEPKGFTEMHYGFVVPISKITKLRFDYQTGDSNLRDIAYMSFRTVVNRHWEISPGIYVRNTSDARVYPGANIYFYPR